jgi:hypothetical protein
LRGRVDGEWKKKEAENQYGESCRGRGGKRRKPRILYVWVQSAGQVRHGGAGVRGKEGPWVKGEKGHAIKG